MASEQLLEIVQTPPDTNASPTLKLFLSRVDDLIARVSKKLGDHADGSE
jgi:hypothetical protein